jgi:hypothetical protein
MAQPRIGDIVEIGTEQGFAYAQYTHKHAQYGALLRVFRDTHPERLHEFRTLVDMEPAFSCFFPLSAAVNRGIVSIVDHVDVPAHLRAFPTFRAGVVDPATGKAAVWWLWDGTTERRVGALTDDLRRLPIREVWNYTLLVERIVSGWTPENDPA